MSNWIQLRSANGYDFDKAELFGSFNFEDDLAKPLRLPRYGCHAEVPWSVAMHSVAVARTIEIVTEDLNAAAAGLLHDAHEAVIGDIMTPVAWAIDYEKIKALKEEVQSAIHFRLKIPEKMWPSSHKEAVRAADAAALEIERREWMAPEPRPWNCPVPEHKWLLAMYNTIKALAYANGSGETDDQLFAREYRRLILRQPAAEPPQQQRNPFAFPSA